jgi:hypothetical protein
MAVTFSGSLHAGTWVYCPVTLLWRFFQYRGQALGATGPSGPPSCAASSHMAVLRQRKKLIILVLAIILVFLT